MAKKSERKKLRRDFESDSYFKGVAMEAKKVQWVTGKELVRDIGIVLLTCTAVSLLLWGLDTGWLAGIQWLLAKA